MRSECTKYPDTYKDMLAHLITMAKEPGMKAYSWHRAKELDADISGLFKGIKEDLAKFMAEQNQISAANSSKLEK